MGVALQKSRTRDWTYYLLLTLSFFSMVNYILRDTIGHIPVIGSLVPAWKELIILLLYIAFYMKSKAEGRFDWKSSRMHKLILFVAIAAVLSGVYNWVFDPETLRIAPKPYTWVPVHLDLSTFVDGIRTLLEASLYFFVLNALLDDEDTIKDMINAMIIAAFLVACYGIYQKLSGVESPKSWVYSEQESNIKLRVFSTIGNPNALGGYMVLITPIALSLAIHAKDWLKRSLYGIVALFLMYTMVMTYSRGAWIGFVAGMALYTVITRNKWLAGIGILGLVAAPFVAHDVVSRLTLAFTPEYLAKSANKGRVEFWGRAIKIWLKNPVFGTGIGTAGDSVATRHNMPGATWIDNQYVKLLAETGIVGLLTYLAMLFAPVINGAKSVFGSKQKGTYLYALNAGITAALFGMIVENVTAAIIEDLNVTTHFWVLIAILYVGVRMAREKANA
ncbi:O-antigen ligase family protein [Tumebacillus sp. ITR2]|uniref:O-antigen ligase family protein n=1 Tax=Tumebacillus amylolyticus TaxID=2801339 RepID=A0ABS1J5B4_9BACL|nr:O-antigen ligase family protein [Tumebacillus amylolyticus]MBL0385471.1 O-antigen ligase family protein [Tumebacillus amylolyticus]